MNQTDGHRTLPHRRRHLSDDIMANITRGECTADCKAIGETAAANKE